MRMTRHPPPPMEEGALLQLSSLCIRGGGGAPGLNYTEPLAEITPMGYRGVHTHPGSEPAAPAYTDPIFCDTYAATGRT